MLKLFTFILIYLFHSINASDVSQKITLLEIYSPEDLIFNDEPPMKIQLKAFDSNGNELNLDGVPVEWSFKRSKCKSYKGLESKLKKFFENKNKFRPTAFPNCFIQ